MKTEKAHSDQAFAELRNKLSKKAHVDHFIENLVTFTVCIGMVALLVWLYT